MGQERSALRGVWFSATALIVECTVSQTADTANMEYVFGDFKTTCTNTFTNTSPFRYPEWPNWDELSCFYWGPEGPWRRGCLGPERALCPGIACPGRPPCLEPKGLSCSTVPHPLQETCFIQDHQPTAMTGGSPGVTEVTGRSRLQMIK